MVAKVLAEAHPPFCSKVLRACPIIAAVDSGGRREPSPSKEGAPVMTLISVEEAAERLGTSPRFIRRLIAERRIAFTTLGRHVRIDTKDIDAFIAAGRVEPLQRSEVS
jgi:excisionase family DNA binding protein